jgi:hypothetical protein
VTDAGPDVTARDAVEIAQRALVKANRVDDLENELDEIRDDLAAMQLRVSEHDNDQSYESLSLDAKVGMVREHAFRKAVDGTGRATLDYDDVQWEVFDGPPPYPMHCYKLLRLAGQARGFSYAGAESPKRLTVDVQEARRGAAFYPENKTDQEAPRG